MIDFDKAAIDRQTGGLKPEFVPESTMGGAGDRLHPNRTGYLAMGQAIDLDLFKPGNRTTARRLGISKAAHTTGLTPGSAVTRSRKRAPRISKLRY